MGYHCHNLYDDVVESWAVVAAAPRHEHVAFVEDDWFVFHWLARRVGRPEPKRRDHYWSTLYMSLSYYLNDKLRRPRCHQEANHWPCSDGTQSYQSNHAST